MNHGNKGRKFGRRTAHRTAMFSNLVKAFLKHEQIQTTLPKAKDLRPIVEKIITLGKKGDLAARKQVISFLRGNCEEVKNLFDNIAKKTAARNGGYTRIIKTGFRQGDAAPMAVIQLVDK